MALTGDPMVENEQEALTLEEKATGDGEKKYLIKGTRLQHEDGSIEQTKMFDILSIPLDDYSDLEFSETEVKRMRMHVMKMKTGIQAMAPLLCMGPVKCPFRLRCPLVDKSILIPGTTNVNLAGQNIRSFPIMRQCIFEREYLEHQRKGYIREYEADVNSPTEMGMINKLAELDLYDYRATVLLANGDSLGEGTDLLKDQMAGTNEDGRAVTKTEIHPILELKSKIQKMKGEILEAMVGTRREQYKQAVALRQQDGNDPSTMISSLRDMIDKVQAKKVEVIDAEFREVEEKTDE